LLILLGLAGSLDFLWRRIPNILVAAVALLWLPHAANLDPALAVTSSGTALTVLAVVVGVWRLGWLGGGDVKLIAALSLWAGPGEVLVLLLAIALSGGALAMISLIAQHPAAAGLLTVVQAHAAGALPLGLWRATSLTTAPSHAASTRRSSSVPYGVAVAAGGCWLVHRLLTA